MEVIKSKWDFKISPKKIVAALKKQKIIRAWRVGDYIFGQDSGENGEFFKLISPKKMNIIKEFPVKLIFKGEEKEFEGCDFMENGKLILGTDNFEC